MNKQHGKFVIVGAGWAGRTIAGVMVDHNPRMIAGFIEDHPQGERVVVELGNSHHFIPYLGTSQELLKIVREQRAAGVVIAVTRDRGDHLLHQIVQCFDAGVPVIEMPEMYAALAKRIPVRHLNSHWIMPHLRAPQSTLHTFLYNVMNYCVSCVIFLGLFIPLLPLLAAAIKLDSPGPVFYRQRRVGKRGVHFTLLKFRTMHKNADKNGAAWTTKDDVRITRVGRWIRRYRLDELPQLINIFKGELALIGPRPEAVELVEWFRKEIPFYEYRYLVLPGITGWAQVNYENTCSVEGALEKLQYDLYWIMNRSLALDLKIIAKSIVVMITGYGAH
ncbi:MAG: sugar transferase [Deltaproteobacteria bacterium]|nr:sugar transferase [Deltaproteobacteria bacterium]